MRKYLDLVFVSVVSIAATVMVLDNKPFIVDGGDPQASCSTEEITNMYEDYIEKWKTDVKSAFNKARSEILKDDTPIPDVIGPDPDPNKCPCGGTGFITHGDGHKTKCPYHGKGSKTIHKNGLIIHEY